MLKNLKINPGYFKSLLFENVLETIVNVRSLLLFFKKKIKKQQNCREYIQTSLHRHWPPLLSLSSLITIVSDNRGPRALKDYEPFEVAERGVHSVSRGIQPDHRAGKESELPESGLKVVRTRPLHSHGSRGQEHEGRDPWMDHGGLS